MALKRSLCIWILTLFFGFPVLGQQPCTFSGHFENSNLKTVVDALGESCGISFSFDTDLLESIPIEDFEVRKQNWSAALQDLLVRHQLALKEISANRFAIVPHPSSTNSSESSLRTITGTVYDEANLSVLPGAQISLYQGTDLPTKGAIADSEGRFSLQIDPKQDNRLLVRLLGYEPKEWLVGDIPDLSIGLKSRPLELEAVIVTGESDQTFHKGQSEGQIGLSPRRLSAISVLGERDVFRTLQFLPGVSSTEESSNGLYIRNSTPDQNLVLIDGVPIYNTGHFFGMFHAFNADALQRVDVSRGGFSVARGGAVAGLIDIESKPSLGDSLSGGLTANLAATSGFLSLPFLKNKAAIMVAGRRSYSDILRSPLYESISGNVFQTGSIFEDENLVGDDDSLEYSLDPVSNFHDIHAKVVFGLGAKGQLSANFYNGRDLVRYTFDSPENATEYKRFSEEQLSLSNNVGGIRYQRQFSKNLKLEIASYATTYRGRFSNEQSISEDADSFEYSGSQNNLVATGALRSMLTWDIKPGHQIIGGLHATRTAASFELGSEEDEVQSLDSITTSASMLSGWLGYSFKKDEWLEISPGARITWYGLDEELYLEPRVQGTVKLPKGFRVNGNIGLYRQFLNPIQISNSLKLGTEFLALASEDNGIQATTSLQSGVGISWMKPGIWVDVQAYHKNLTGLERYVRSFDIELNANDIDDLLSDGEGDILGLDVLVRGHIGPWVGWAGYTISSVEHYFPELSEGNRFAADHDHLHELKLVNMLRLDRWEFSLTWVFASGKPYSVPVGIDSLVDGDGNPFIELRFQELNGQRLPSYHRLDANISYNFPTGKRGNGQVGISFFNIYNRENIRDRNYSVHYPDQANAPLEIVRVDRELLGFSPNVFLRWRF